MNTKKHFRNLVDIAKEEGILSAFKYDFLVTRSRNKIINYVGSCFNLGIGIHYCEVTSKNYTATYAPEGVLVGLELR